MMRRQNDPTGSKNLRAAASWEPKGSASAKVDMKAPAERPVSAAKKRTAPSDRIVQ